MVGFFGVQLLLFVARPTRYVNEFVEFGVVFTFAVVTVNAYCDDVVVKESAVDAFASNAPIGAVVADKVVLQSLFAAFANAAAVFERRAAKTLPMFGL